MKRQRWIVRSFWDTDYIYLQIISGKFYWTSLETQAKKFSEKEMLEFKNNLSENPELKKYNASFQEY
jgi:hypothetical protein